MANIFAPQALPSSPTSQQTTTGGISSWAQPYVKDLLSQAQGLSATPTGLQQQSYTGAENLNVAPQIGQATGLAGGAAQGALGTAGTALGYGQQAAGAGQQYASMATDPSSIQAYMSPYIQQALAPQLQMLNQQQALAGQGINAQATGQGAFGGNRATLAQGLNAQNYDLARQQAIGQGYQNAFTQAQQAQQFGSTLGLQGLQTGLQGVQGAQNAYGLGLQGAQTLGQLGQNQYNQQANTVQLQNQLGTQQYLMPQQLLQAKAGILQGLPVGTQTTTGYQAAPNTASQIGGLGTAALGTLGLLNQAGALNGIKNLFPGSNIGAGNTQDIMSGGQGGGGAFTPSGGGPSFDLPPQGDVVPLPSLPSAKGGIIRTKSYAKGGLVSLALEQALKG